MRVDLASVPSVPGAPNEDFAAVALPSSGVGGVAVVLDGVSAPADGEMGCRHGTPWFTTRLGGGLLELAARRESPLQECLAEAVARTAAAHSTTCDLLHPRTPQATLVAVRWGGEELEYLVLGDSELMVERVAEPLLSVRDTRVEDVRLRPDMRQWRLRLDALSIGSVEWQQTMREYQRFADRLRNAEGGFFTAAADPQVSAEVVRDRLPLTTVRGFGLLTDGVTQWTDTFDRGDRTELFTLLKKEGCQGLIDRVRAIEGADATAERFPRRKARDDASAVHVEV